MLPSIVSLLNLLCRPLVISFGILLVLCLLILYLNAIGCLTFYQRQIACLLPFLFLEFAILRLVVVFLLRLVNMLRLLVCLAYVVYGLMLENLLLYYFFEIHYYIRFMISQCILFSLFLLAQFILFFIFELFARFIHFFEVLVILIISLNFKKYLQQGCEKAVILKMEKFLIIFHAFIIIIKLKPRNFIASLVTNFLISIFNLFCFLIFIMVLLHLLMTWFYLKYCEEDLSLNVLS